MVKWTKNRSNQPVSNLIVRPQPTAGLGPETQMDLPTANSDDGIKFREVWKTLLRRRKLVLITTGIVFALALTNAINKRIKNPLYSGSFTLLISDPLGDELGRNSGGVGMFEQLALNTTSIDIPTLIEVLRSPVLLKPTAAKIGISPSSLVGRINILQEAGVESLK